MIGCVLALESVNRQERSHEMGPSETHSLIQLGHAPDHGFLEGVVGGGQSHQCGRLDVFYHFLEGLELLSLVVSTDKVFLVLGELAGDGVGSVGGDETLRVGCDLLAGRGLYARPRPIFTLVSTSQNLSLASCSVRPLSVK
jgi:hypothetical protein